MSTTSGRLNTGEPPLRRMSRLVQFLEASGFRFPDGSPRPAPRAPPVQGRGVPLFRPLFHPRGAGMGFTGQTRRVRWKSRDVSSTPEPPPGVPSSVPLARGPRQGRVEREDGARKRRFGTSAVSRVPAPVSPGVAKPTSPASLRPHLAPVFLPWWGTCAQCVLGLCLGRCACGCAQLRVVGEDPFHILPPPMPTA